MKTPTISVIVPVYNVEAYLPRCVDSILAQTFTDFELILVDDGSPDRCEEICDAYAEKDSRVRVIHKANGGVSSARNAALDVAYGKYIAFCDSDDYWEPILLEKSICGIEASCADWVAFNYQFVDDVGKISGGRVYPAAEYTFSDWDNKLSFFIEHFVTGDIGWCIWARLFRRDLIEKHHIRFSETCNNYAEDFGFCAKYLLCTNKIVSIDDCLYYYYQRAGSMMDQSKTIIKLHELNEVSYDVCAFMRNTVSGKQYKNTVGLVHYYIMNDQYHRLRPFASNKKFREECRKIKRKDWFRTGTKAIFRNFNRLASIIGKNPARLILLFSFGTLTYNWYPYLFMCKISQLRHRS